MILWACGACDAARALRLKGCPAAIVPVVVTPTSTEVHKLGSEDPRRLTSCHVGVRKIGYNIGLRGVIKKN